MRSVCISVSVDVTISENLKSRDECGQLGARHTQLQGWRERTPDSRSGRRLGRARTRLQRALATTSQFVPSVLENHSPATQTQKEEQGC